MLIIEIDINFVKLEHKKPISEILMCIRNEI